MTWDGKQEAETAELSLHGLTVITDMGRCPCAKARGLNLAAAQHCTGRYLEWQVDH
jgi:hypothetical protein